MLSKNKILKLLGLNSGIIVSNIILFSEGLLGFSVMSANVPIAALSVTALAMSGLAFTYGNYKIISQPTILKVYDETVLIEEKDYIKALEEQSYKKVFEDLIDLAKNQISRIKKKSETLDMLLQQKFSPSEMSYVKFKQAILDSENLVNTNIKNSINRMAIFDYTEYLNISKNLTKNLTPEIIESKNKLFREHILYVKNSLDKNENIFIKLDDLLLEVSKLDESNENDIKNLNTIQEIDKLIEQTKLYK